MPSSRSSQQLAHHLCRLSLADGQIAPERVTAVLAYLQRHPPRQPLTVLKQYHRLVARQLARHHARVEHAGAIDATILEAIAAAFSRRYQRSIAATAEPNPALIAGLRIRIGDDLYDASIAGQLEALAAAT